MSRILCVVALLALATTSNASAQRRPALRSGPHRAPLSANSAAIALGGATALGSGVALFLSENPYQGAAGWRGGILFDDAGRSALRMGSEEGLDAAAAVSDLLLVASMLNAVVLDSTLTPLLQGDADLALQAHSAHMLALGISLSLVEVVKRAVGRARPFTEACTGPECTGGDTNASFYSGHATMAFTSAGFSCAMHLSRQLYGDAGADVAACAGALALAAGTGILRVAADRHYLTDVILGSVMGFAVGYLVTLGVVPAIGATSSAGDASDFSAVVVPMVSPNVTSGGTLGGSAGISVVGSF